MSREKTPTKASVSTVASLVSTPEGRLCIDAKDRKDGRRIFVDFATPSDWRRTTQARRMRGLAETLLRQADYLDRLAATDGEIA